MSKNIAIIGSGFSSLSAACYLAKAGHKVAVFEKNDTPGGRARQYKTDQYTFDMGPSWYWMPDVFDRFFKDFGKRTSDYYDLIRLDPSYRVIFQDQSLDIPASLPELEDLFETVEAGSSKKLRSFLKQAEYKYQVGINKLVYKPGRSLKEFVDIDLFRGLLKMDVFTSMSSHVRKHFKNKNLIQLMEFPVLFLGATPQNTPALYSLMNYADLALGTWYPKGGMFEIVKAMVSLAESLGVQFHYSNEITSFNISNKKINSIITPKQEVPVDIVVGGADYHHIEQHILPEKFRVYSKKYWDSRVMAPSSMIYYLGVNKPLPKMKHHLLFFDEDFGLHANEIYENPKWPTKPLLYTSTTSKTDKTVAPENHENLMVLIPTAPDLEDTESIREKYFDFAIQKLEYYNETDIASHIDFKRSYAHKDFKSDYHAFKGNAYGLANTLLQTAILKPSLKSKKITNLYYTGQLTTPGPGVPPSIISGKVVSEEIKKDFRIF